MAGEYGFKYQRNQHRWVHPQNRHVPFTGNELVAAPRTLSQFRLLWDPSGESPSRQFTCTLVGPSGVRHEWTLDNEADYQSALMAVVAGEHVVLTVSNAVTSSKDMETNESEINSHGACPPEWFTKYMVKFRSDLMEEIGQLIDQKLSHSHRHGHNHHHQKPIAPSAPKEMLSPADFKCLKIEKKLQKLQRRTQLMSLDLDAAVPSPHKAKGERKLSKISRRMEQLEAKKSKIAAKIVSRNSLGHEVVADAPSSDLMMVDLEEMPLQKSLTPNRPPAQYDCCVLTDVASILHVAVGSTFTKTWNVKNVGELPWSEKTELRLAHATAGLTSEVEKVSVPVLQPGEEGDISISFNAPSFPGMFETYWHLYNGDDRFGQWLSCSVSVDPIPGEQVLESTPLNSSLTLHPAIKEIQEVDLTGSQMGKAAKDSEEFNSDDDDDDDDYSSDSDFSDSFVHIPMPKCYQYSIDNDCDDRTVSMPEASTSAPATETCKAPPTTPMNEESDSDAQESSSTSIKYPVLDLDDLKNMPSFPVPLQQTDQQASVRESTPVHILPESLVTGAMTVAAKAYSSAEAIMRSLHNSSSSISSQNARSPVDAIPETAALLDLGASGPASVPADIRTQNLITLAEMGFYDAKLNNDMLTLYKDNLQDAIAGVLRRTPNSGR